MKRPAAICGFTIYAVIILQNEATNTEISAAIILFSAAFLILSLILLFSDKRNLLLFTAILICLSGITASIAYYCKVNTEYKAALSITVKENCNIEGTVLSSEYENNDYLYVIKLNNADNRSVTAKLVIKSYSDLFLLPGDNISGTVKGIYEYGSGNTKKTNMADGKYLYSPSVTNLHIEKNSENSFIILVNKIKIKLKDRILRACPEKSGGLLCGIILGDTANLSFKAKNSFRRIGLSHIFAVSGFHITVWSMMSYSILSVFIKSKKILNIASLFFAFIVCGVTGFSPSSLRAVFMLSVIYLAQCFRYDGDILNSLGLSLIIICLTNPFSGGSISLMLSAGATVGIAVYNDHISPLLRKTLWKYIRNRHFRNTALSFISTLAFCITVSAVTLPLLLYLFGKVSILSPLGNLIVVPLTELTMIIGGIGAIINLRPLIQIAGLIGKFILALSDAMASMDFAYTEIKFTYFLISLFIVSIFAIAIFIIKRKKLRYAFTAIAISAITVIFTCSHNFINRNNTCISLSCTNNIGILIRQGSESIFICTEKTNLTQANMISDCGVYRLDYLYTVDKGNIEVIAESFSPKNIFTGSADLKLKNGTSITSNGDYIKIKYGNDTAYIVSSENDLQNIKNADILIINELSENNFDSTEYDKVYVFGNGENTDNILYTKNTETSENTEFIFDGR